MTAISRGGVRWLDQMRITREHMSHLQATLLDGIVGLRETLGAGVVYGYSAHATGPGKVEVAPGLALDAFGRPLILTEAREVELAPDAVSTGYLVALHKLRSTAEVGGVPSILFDHVAIEVRPGPPPFEDGAVPFAGVKPGEEGPDVFRSGEWYLPPASHTHSGAFVELDGHTRYDGHPLGAGLAAPPFDSGWVRLIRGRRVQLVHGLQTDDLLVQVQSRTAEGLIGTRGLGSEFWYELRDIRSMTLARADAGDDELELRARAWPLGAAAITSARPIADAGEDIDTELGESFTLDGSGSRGLGERRITRYEWTLVD